MLILQDAAGRTLPLWVDDDAAATVAAAARGERDTTSPAVLLAAALAATGGAIDRVELRSVQGGVLKAVVVIVGALGTIELAARASHAVAAALVVSAPVVADEVVVAHLDQRLRDAAARSSPPTAASGAAVDEPLTQSTAERWNTLLQHLAEKIHDERPS